MDTELFELCKEVSKKTGWGLVISPAIDIDDEHFDASVHPEILPCYQDGILVGDEFFNGLNVRGTVPLYTSDYLLDKLQEKRLELTRIQPADGSEPYWACNVYDGVESHYYAKSKDTPLVALLKLTSALHDAGELK